MFKLVKWDLLNFLHKYNWVFNRCSCHSFIDSNPAKWSGIIK